MHYANTYLEKPVVPDVKITGEGTTDVLKCMLNTGSDIYQGACKKRGSTLKEEYKNASGTCYMDPRDMAKLGRAAVVFQAFPSAFSILPSRSLPCRAPEK